MCDISTKCDNCGSELDYSENTGLFFCDNQHCERVYMTEAFEPKKASKRLPSVRDRIAGLESPIARQLLGACCDEFETFFAGEQDYDTIPAVLPDVDYLAQERELRILIYENQVANGQEIEFLQ